MRFNLLHYKPAPDCLKEVPGDNLSLCGAAGGIRWYFYPQHYRAAW